VNSNSAVSLIITAYNMATPCSVNIYGMLFLLRSQLATAKIAFGIWAAFFKRGNGDNIFLWEIKYVDLMSQIAISSVPILQQIV